MTIDDFKTIRSNFVKCAQKYLQNNIDKQTFTKVVINYYITGHDKLSIRYNYEKKPTELSPYILGTINGDCVIEIYFTNNEKGLTYELIPINIIDFITYSFSEFNTPNKSTEDIKEPENDDYIVYDNLK